MYEDFGYDVGIIYRFEAFVVCFGMANIQRVIRFVLSMYLNRIVQTITVVQIAVIAIMP